MDINTQDMKINLKIDDSLKKDVQMTSSTLSTGSSLTSPVDSGVQMLDSESDLTSVLSSASFGKTQSSITEDLNISENPETKTPEEQIVFRRQRKKRSKTDTPKKRVSFHEDILNSTKIDDIHINLGFITQEPDVSLSFFQRGFVRKPDVVKGRYSWAAEGDAPFYEKTDTNRDIKSEIYIHQPRYSSSSCSSTGSSIDEEEDSSSDENVPPKEPTLKHPKSSCLKKTKHRKYINTNIVQEEVNLKKKRSESNLLDTNIFGSLKNILSFSTSVPLAERGVPEGQEDIEIYSSTSDLSARRKSFGNFSFQNTETVEEVRAEPVSRAHLEKTNLKLTKSEGFYPNYPNQEIPANIILCDSNVYEHKGISYSYEYDNFQKSFGKENKPKSSMMYQRIFKEFNLFRRKAKEEPECEVEEDFEVIGEASAVTKPEIVEVVEVEEVKTPEPKQTPSKLNKSYDSSDSVTLSDFYEGRHTKHLDSPKRKVRRTNHYTLWPFKIPLSEIPLSENTMESAKSVPNLRLSSSKSFYINRFLNTDYLKKMLDIRSQRNMKFARNYIGLCPKRHTQIFINHNRELDYQIETEVVFAKENLASSIEALDEALAKSLRKLIIQNKRETLLKAFPVHTACITNGVSKPLLLVLTNCAIYIVNLKQSVFFSLPYTDLRAILIGPNGQAIHLSNYNLDLNFVVATGCSRITTELICQLEIAIRRDLNKPPFPAYNHMSMRDMVNLRREIFRQTVVEKDEDYTYYGIVNVQDLESEDNSSEMDAVMEGPLMFKTDEDSERWETAYCVLKGGVLHMYSSVSQRVPIRVFPLINGACQGARRVYNCLRPHTFQLIVDGNTLNLAAPDEYVASQWLQELVYAASGIYNHSEKLTTLSCSLLMTNYHILTVREAFPCSTSFYKEKIKNPQVLSCAAITDLVSFRLPSFEQSWCVLEFSCPEVHEYSGDWIVYFSTNAELDVFISTLRLLWQYGHENGNDFPLDIIPETDPLSTKCADTYKSIVEAWPLNTNS